MPGEGAWDPGVGIIKVPVGGGGNSCQFGGDSNEMNGRYAPNSNAHASTRGKTSTRHGAIIRRLLLKPSSRRRQAGEAHIDLGIRNLNTKRSKRVDLRQQRRFTRRRPDDEVALQTHTVNLGPVGLHLLDERYGVGGLGAGVLDVVVIVVQLGARVGSGGRREGQGDVVEAHGVVEDVGAVAARVVEGFIDDVPGVALALVVADFAGDVGFDDGG